MITKITKAEAKIAAKLYIAMLFALSDSFNTDNGYIGVEGQSTSEVNNKIQDEIDLIVSKMLKGLDYERLPTTSYDCITVARDIKEKESVMIPIHIEKELK